jgi:hypothetical protein
MVECIVTAFFSDWVALVSLLTSVFPAITLVTKASPVAPEILAVTLYEFDRTIRRDRQRKSLELLRSLSEHDSPMFQSGESDRIVV